MATAFPELEGRVDVVACNPPYIPLEAFESVAPEARDHDPALALWSGDDGLDAIRVLESRAAVAAASRGLGRAPSTPTSRDASAVEVFVGGGPVERRTRPSRPGRSRALRDGAAGTMTG